MSEHSTDREKHLQRNLKFLLAVIPNKDAELEFDEVSADFFDRIEDYVGEIELIFMQLGKVNGQLNRAFRSGAARLLQDKSKTLNMATRVFISDLVREPPISRINKQSTLVRDVLIIWALMILKEMGRKPTANEATRDGSSGSQALFEHLVTVRNLTFADSKTTIEKRWSERRACFERIGLSHLIPSD